MRLTREKRMRRKGMDPRDYARFQLNHRRVVAVDMRNEAERREDENAVNKLQKLINDIDKELEKLNRL